MIFQSFPILVSQFFFCLQLHKADKRYLIIISTRASQGVDGNDDGPRVDV